MGGSPRINSIVQQGRSRIHRVINKLSLHVAACNIRCAPVRVYMIWSILGIIFNNKYSTLIPYPALTQVVNK